MAVKNVRKMIARLSEVEKLIEETEKTFEKLKKKHWKILNQLQQKCAETLHDLTAEEIQLYKQEKAAHEKWVCDRRSYRYSDLREMWRHMPNMSVLYFKISNGYNCPYCGARIGNTIQTFDEDSRSFLEDWLKKDTSSWPLDKKTWFEESKKEFEEYFNETEHLEQSLESLRKEKTKIKKQLEKIWNLCDKALGKGEQRWQEENEREARWRKIAKIPSRDDVYYTD